MRGMKEERTLVREWPLTIFESIIKWSLVIVMEHFAIFIEYLLSFFIFSRFILLWLYALYTKKKRILNQKKELENKGLHECWGNLKKIQKERWDIEKWNSFIPFFSHSNTYYTFQISQFFFHFITWKLPTWDEESFYTSGKCWNIILSVNQSMQTPHLCSTLCTNTNYNIFPFNIVAMENWSLYFTNTNQRILQFNIRVTRN